MAEMSKMIPIERALLELDSPLLDTTSKNKRLIIKPIAKMIYEIIFTEILPRDIS